MSGPHIHLDAVGGIAGDMFVAAMCAALPDLVGRVLADISAVLPPEAGMPVLAEGSSGGIAASRLVLRDAAYVPEDRAGHDHHHHGHGHHHHDRDADHHHDHHHHAGGDAGSFADMRARIGAAKLSAGTAGHAIAILTALADVEAAIHGVPLDAVHFHEIADWDSLMDIVAAGSIVAALPGASWSVSDLPLGGGLVKTAHGMLPVPAPATAKLLEGFGWRDDGVPGERVTPTGAAILRHLAPARRNPGGKLRASGYGAGTRDLPGLPNVLRTLVFDAAAAGDDEQVAVLCFEIDDMTGEEIAAAAESLRAVEGVLDLSIDSRLGKKARMMSGFRLLVRPDALDGAIARCLLESSTIGLRWHIENRRVLPRAQHAVDSGGRRVRLKTVTRPDGSQTAKAESDDLGADSLGARRLLQRDAER